MKRFDVEAAILATAILVMIALLLVGISLAVDLLSSGYFMQNICPIIMVVALIVVIWLIFYTVLKEN